MNFTIHFSQRWRQHLAAGLLAGTACWAQAGDDFLAPEQAFRASAAVATAHSVELRFDIAPGYHLYRERLSFEATPDATALGPAQLPAGTVSYDKTFEKNVETYSGALRITLPVLKLPARGAQDLTLAVSSQGCADAGLCYPPQQQRWRVHAQDGAVQRISALGDDTTAPPAASSAGTVTPAATAYPAAAATPSEGSRIEAALQSGSLWQVAGVFLLAGLLLSFTPCVLPMLPILSSIIVGQGTAVSRARGLSLSLAYSLGMALVYTGFGVAAGLAGEGLAAALQQPAVLGAFASLLVLLSLSMFGLYELQLPHALQSRLNNASMQLQGGRYAGVFAMGGLSALIVGPCVAAPLAGALVFISQTRNVFTGGLALFSLAAGMSVPLLLVGLSAGALLPRAGAWMEGVKRCFGFLLLALAVWMVSPVLPAWALMGLAGAWLLLAAGWLGAFSRLPEAASGWARTRTSLALLLALLGAAEIVGLLGGGRDPLTPLAGLAARGGSLISAQANTPQLAAGPTFRRVRSVAELDAALASAPGHTLVDFYADWCVACKEMEHLTFADPRVRAELGKLQLLQVDVTANSAEDRALLKRFALFGPPGIVFLTPSGRELSQARVLGYLDADTFVQRLQTLGS